MSKSKTTSVKKKNQLVIPVGNGWAVKGEASLKFTLITDNKRDAVTFAKDIAKNNNADLIVYSKDGNVSERNSYTKTDSSIAKR